MAEHNQQEYNEARKQAISNDGLNDVAIDLHGRIYIQDQESGEVQLVTPQEYNELRQNGNYQPLTNSNLLYLRANDPSFTFKNDILKSQVIIEKSEKANNANMYYHDGSYVTDVRKDVELKEFPSGFNDTGSFILICAGGN